MIWQTGKLYFDANSKSSRRQNRQWNNYNRISDANGYGYAAANIIISRAGALSISELCIIGKPVIFVPSPNVSEDHQTKMPWLWWIKCSDFS
ncbi:MAG: hypothetical protein IPO64_11545 [Bacteroidetes bacterium]|nr:hypothetical protein [Bacteroidota bacterium]